ncbi:hypothetical protein [Leisingera caerulea]|uniref:hypothetical protein n=1 Tax=Leisingera caerulea TaxID=506591 RepID=UPI0021A6C35E|nr:hypothetical protein [Leisingera caerulea]
MSAPEYIFEASTKPSLPWHEVPLIRATEESVKGYGCLVDDAETFEIEIVQWPAQGWRPVDEGTGDEAGWVEGTFRGDWRGDVLYGENEAVNGSYVLGWSTDPQQAQADKQCQWHLKFPQNGQAKIPQFCGFGCQPVQ